ncbi:type III-A CRISPR-associated RAMP protein Csm4 [Deinococcus kurensis]|uniref:type III-A CRISPR-associated RAMP protein Csm4 n=1 Tax=Deinococcus kurensis TaxID=2662757 RepID=UPI0012D30B4D|nr:hypothetical protein [Deinococcus kurensis]
MRRDLIVLTFTQPLRGRDLRAGYLPSDLLWGALYAANVRLQGDPLPAQGSFRVSSAFPFVDGEWLLPKPRVTAEAASASPAAGRADKKAVKGLEFVRLGDFLTLAAGQPLSPEALAAAQAWQRRALLPVTPDATPLAVSAEDLARLARRVLKSDPDTWTAGRYGAPIADLSASERLHAWFDLRGRASAGRADRQRNAQDRVTQATDTFMTESLAQPRLAFLLESAGDAPRARLLAALRLLADTGLGGMRTQGSGQFMLDVHPVPATLATRLDGSGPHVLLSLTHPTEGEAQAIDDSPDSRYGLRRRDGYLDGTPLQRQDVWMLAEGSLMPGPLDGRVLDVSPPDHPHPVWRSGLCVSVAVSGGAA